MHSKLGKPPKGGFFHLIRKWSAYRTGEEVMKRRKRFCILLVITTMLFAAGCGHDRTDDEEYVTWNNTRGCLTENGYFYTADSADGVGILLYYYDFSSGYSVPVCDKAECSHQAVDLSAGKDATCNAQIDTYGEFVVYQDSIYYISFGERKLLLRRRDVDGNNDENVTSLDAAYLGGRMWFYRDMAFIMASTGVSNSFDPQTKASDASVMRLFAVDLKTGKTEIVAESSMTAAVDYAFNIYQMKDGKVFFYDLEKDGWFVYDTETGQTEEQMNIGKNSRMGETGEYYDLYDHYCYSVFEDGKGHKNIMRLDRETGEEKVIYSGNAQYEVGYAIEDMKCMLISELNMEQEKIENICFYDMEEDEIYPFSDAYFAQEGLLPFLWSKEAVIYPHIENNEGDIRDYYVPLQDVIKGNIQARRIGSDREEG